MIITFNGVELAREEVDGGTDGVEGFLPKGRQSTQVQPFFRAPWSSVVERGNRVVTLAGKITPAPCASAGAARLALMLRFGSLPTSGPPTFTEEDTVVTYDPAVLETCEIVDYEGVSYAVQLSFTCGGSTGAGGIGAKVTTPLLDSTGEALTDSTGHPLLD